MCEGGRRGLFNISISVVKSGNKIGIVFFRGVILISPTFRPLVFHMNLI